MNKKEQDAFLLAYNGRTFEQLTEAKKSDFSGKEDIYFDIMKAKGADKPAGASTLIVMGLKKKVIDGVVESITGLKATGAQAIIESDAEKEKNALLEGIAEATKDMPQPAVAAMLKALNDAKQHP
jgi:hypothetical protein